MRLKALRESIIALREEIAAMSDEEEIEEGEEGMGSENRESEERVERNDNKEIVEKEGCGDSHGEGKGQETEEDNVAAVVAATGDEEDVSEADLEELDEEEVEAVGRSADPAVVPERRGGGSFESELELDDLVEGEEKPANQAGRSSDKGRRSSVSPRQLGASLQEVDREESRGGGLPEVAEAKARKKRVA